MVNVGLLLFLILMNGIFAMSEIALVTARKSRLKRLADDGDKGAAAALALGENSTRFLSTIQIGITAIGILNGIVGEAALAGPLARVLVSFGLGDRAASWLATAIVVVAITLVSIVFGELVPKRLAQFNAEGIARFMSRPVAMLAQLARPFVFILSTATDAVLRLFGKSHVEASSFTEEDIQAIIADSSQAGVIEKQEHEMVRNVFRLDERPISSLMTPRSEAVYLDIEQPLQTIIDTLIESNHSRFPVCRGGMEDVLGTISAKRLLRKYIKAESDEVQNYIQPPVFAPETLTGMKLLEQFRETGERMVFVIDEYGEVQGLVTMHNLLEALAGEFKARDPEDVWAVRREDGSWLIDGLIPIPELKDRLELRAVPEEGKGRFNTLGGMMMWLIGNMPRTGDVVTWEDWRLEVVDLDKNRVDKVLASRGDAEIRTTI